MKNQELICRGQIIEFNMVYRNNSNNKVELSDVEQCYQTVCLGGIGCRK